MILGRKVTAQDVVWLRREVFAGGVVTREEADELFAVARAHMDNAPEWKFFFEMIARHVISPAEPVGVVTEERAAWLLRRVDRMDRRSLAALANVLAEAHSVPQWFLDAGGQGACVATGRTPAERGPPRRQDNLTGPTDRAR